MIPLIIILFVLIIILIGAVAFWVIDRNIDGEECDLSEPETILNQVKSGQRSTYDGLVTYEKET